MRPEPATVTFIASVDAPLANQSALQTDDGWLVQWTDFLVAIIAGRAEGRFDRGDEEPQCDKYNEEGQFSPRVVSFLGATEIEYDRLFAFGRCFISGPSFNFLPLRWTGFAPNPVSTSPPRPYLLGPRVDTKRLTEILERSAVSPPSERENQQGWSLFFSFSATKGEQSFRVSLGAFRLNSCFLSDEQLVLRKQTQTSSYRGDYGSVEKLLYSRQQVPIVVQLHSEELFRDEQVPTAPATPLTESSFTPSSNVELTPFLTADIDGNGELTNDELLCSPFQYSQKNQSGNLNTNKNQQFCSALGKRLNKMLRCQLRSFFWIRCPLQLPTFRFLTSTLRRPPWPCLTRYPCHRVMGSNLRCWVGTAAFRQTRRVRGYLLRQRRHEKVFRALASNLVGAQVCVLGMSLMLRSISV